jgi:hypothetical protein
MHVQMEENDDSGSLIANFIAGGVAGAVATWAMGKATELLYETEDKTARDREDAVRGGTSAFGVAAEKVANLAGRSLSKKQSEGEGSRLHWALGIGAGAVYGALRSRVPDVGAAGGLGFGTAFWALMDEGVVYALGLTPGPTKFPWQAHARGLAGHLVYGAATDAVLSVIRDVA